MVLARGLGIHNILLVSRRLFTVYLLKTGLANPIVSFQSAYSYLSILGSCLNPNIDVRYPDPFVPEPLER
jgi:hypothetical protein